MGKHFFIALPSFNPKGFAKHELIDLISQQLIGKRLRIATGAFCQPLHRLLGKLVEPPWAQRLLTGKKQRPILRRKGIVDRRACRPQGRDTLSTARQPPRPARQRRHQLHHKGRPALTLPHRLNQLFRA